MTELEITKESLKNMTLKYIEENYPKKITINHPDSTLKKLSLPQPLEKLFQEALTELYYYKIITGEIIASDKNISILGKNLIVTIQNPKVNFDKIDELEFLKLLDKIKEIIEYFPKNKKSLNSLTTIKREKYLNIFIGNLYYVYLDIYNSVKKSLEIDDFYMKLNLIMDCIIFLQNSCSILSYYMNNNQYQYHPNNEDNEIREIRNDTIGHPIDRLGNIKKGGKHLSIISHFDTQFPVYKYEKFIYDDHESNKYRKEVKYFNIYSLSIPSLENVNSFLKKIKNDIYK